MLFVLLSIALASPRFVSVSAGEGVTCGIDTGGALHCAGDDRLAEPPAGRFVQVSAGTRFACALGEDHSVRCWGTGGTVSFAFPDRRIVRIATTWVAGSSFAGVDVLDDRGLVHACGLDDAGKLACPETVGVSVPNRVADIAASERRVYALDDLGYTGWTGMDFDHRTGVAGGTFRAIDAGGAGLCGLRPDGTLVCWGGEWDRIPSPPGRFGQVSVGGVGLCALTAEGALSCWGRRLEPRPTPGGTFAAVSVGDSHTCAIDGEGAVHCWGRDEGGRGAPPGEPADLENRYVAAESLALRSLPGPSGETIEQLPRGERCRTREPNAAAPLWVCGTGRRVVGYLDAASLGQHPTTEEGARFQQATDAERSRERIRDEADPAARGRLLLAERRARYEGLARVCAFSGRVKECADALRAAADAAQVELDRAPPPPIVPCDPAGACLPGRVRVETLGATGVTRFTAFTAAGTHASTVSGTWDGKVLRVLPPVEGDDPLLAPVLDALVSQGVTTVSLEAPLLGGDVSGDRFWHFSLEFLPRPVLASDRVLCEEGDRYVPREPGPLVEPVVEEDGYTGRLYMMPLQRMPCRTGWIFDREISGIPRVPVPRYPLADPPFVDGARVLAFGAVTVEQRVPAGGNPPYGTRCHIASRGHTLALGSSYGCDVYLAADLNEDGVTDFVIHTGSESCETDTLWMSEADGWVAVARRTGCC